MKRTSVSVYLKALKAWCKAIVDGESSPRTPSQVVVRYGGSHPALPFDFGELNRLPWLTHSVCLDGALHWVLDAIKAILVFDLRDEEFHVIRLPNMGMYLDPPQIVLLQVDGHLVAISLGYGSNYEKIDIMWTSKDYRNKVWIKDTIFIPLRWWNDCVVSAIPASGKILLIPIRSFGGISMGEGYLGFYDAKQKIFQYVKLVELSEGRFLVFGAVNNYTESIFSLRELPTRE
ncbi:unnamed protein product [Ilex paraguariensis]|uniref:F-box associated beta-propeller type 3 domain-containing protein n=1 Tax=Ilex paraguariensis TaxID=185542 RepID=A0ABC8SJI9_9AQUA